MRPSIGFPLAFLLLGITPSCGSSPCISGAQVSCACPDGSNGAQTCRADGSGFNGCICGAGTTTTSSTGTTTTSAGTGGNGGGGGSAGGNGGGTFCTPDAQKPCYTGPPNTSGMGICAPGAQICNQDGSAYGPCVGDITPKPETCATPGDDDCNGMANEGGADCACAPGSMGVCYTGPMMTAGVGLCHGGLQTCKADGTGYGGCMGEVTPTVETCVTLGDDDCDGLVNEEGPGCMCNAGSIADCYTGPANTLGLGVCKGGKKTCNAQGTGYGPCEGEITPKPENCNTATDESCDGSAGPCGGQSGWSKGFVASAGVIARSIAVDVAGNAIITGAFQGTVDFGGGPLVSVGDPGFNVFVVKYDSSGNHQWSKRFGDGVAAGQNGFGVAVDIAGNVLVTGGFGGTIDFGGGALVAPPGTGSDIFVAKFTTSGTWLWSRQFGNSDPNHYEDGWGIAGDPAGNVLVTGRFYKNVDFGGGLLSGLMNNTPLFVLKLSPAGDHVWSKTSMASPATAAITADSVGNVLVTGNFSGNMNLGGGVIQSVGGGDLFVTKLGPAGNHLWSKRFGDTLDEAGKSIAVDANGNVAITGYFDKTLDFGAGNLGGGAPSGTHKGFVAELDAAGNHLWSRGFGAVYADSWGVAVDGNNNVLMTGEVRGDADFGGGVLPGGGGVVDTDVYVGKYDPTGNLIWAARYGDTSPQGGYGIGVSPSTNPYVTGVYSGAINFGDAGTPFTMKSTVFLAKLAP